jgi:hypothetical protein
MLIHSIKMSFQNIFDFTVNKIHCNCAIKVSFKAYNLYKWFNGRILCGNCALECNLSSCSTFNRYSETSEKNYVNYMRWVYKL